MMTILGGDSQAFYSQYFLSWEAWGMPSALQGLGCESDNKYLYNTYCVLMCTIGP